jgi:hypothetical protein
MHHIAFCTSCLEHFNLGHLYSYPGRSHRVEIGDKKEQVQWVFGGPQALSCEDANIVVIKTSPGASHHNP